MPSRSSTLSRRALRIRRARASLPVNNSTVLDGRTRLPSSRHSAGRCRRRRRSSGKGVSSSAFRASHSRSSAAMRPSKNARTSMPSPRSGVAVRPRSSRVGGGRGSPVGASLCVVELVDDDDRVRTGRDVGDSVCRQRLDGGEDVIPALGAGAADVELAEVGVVQDLAVGAHGLLEDLATVSDEEQRRRRSVPRSHRRL